MTLATLQRMGALRVGRTAVPLARFLAVALRFIVAGLFLAVPTTAQPGDQAGRQCKRGADFYEQQGYVVKDIRIETPLGFLDAVRKPLELKLKTVQGKLLSQNLGLKIGAGFSNSGYTRLLAALGQELVTLEPGERFKFAADVPALRSCDASAKTLEVVYWIVTTEPLSYVTNIFEKRHDKLTRSLALGALAKVENKILPQPYLGYNRSRGLFGGTHASFTSGDGFINRADVDVSGSGSSATGDFNLSGARDFSTGLINHAQWNLGYRYSNIPSDAVRLKDGTVLAQLFAATKPLGRRGLLLRFGSAIEGGNRQTDLAPSAIPAKNRARSGYGAAKAYVGGTLNQGRQAWTASYGLQLGSDGEAVSVNFVKHLFDTAYTVRFLPRAHRPLRLDAQFTAGWIQSSSGRIPVGERFFGGNVPRDFIQGDDWRIRSTPVIRSFPQNRLNRTGAGTPIGGENFFSVNLTLAQTIWHRPAIPGDILEDVRVKLALGGQLASSRLFAKASYLVEKREFTQLKAQLKTQLDGALKTVLADLQEIEPPPETIAEDIGDLKDDIETARTVIAETDATLDLGQIRSLIAGFELDTGTTPSKVGSIIATIREDILPPLQDAGLTARRAKLETDANALETVRAKMKADFDAVKQIGAIDPQELTPAQALLPNITMRLNRLDSLLTVIEQQTPPLSTVEHKNALQGAVDNARSYLKAAQSSVDAAAESDAESANNNLHLLAEGFGAVSPAMLTGVIETSRQLQRLLAKDGLAQQGEALVREAEWLAPLQKQINDALKRVHLPDIEQRAMQDVAYTQRVLDVIFRELNLFAVSPVLMLDAARIGPRTATGFSGVRYGIGAGVRLSIVTLDLTGGYSWNPNPRPGEGRGAFVFSMDISDLFR